MKIFSVLFSLVCVGALVRAAETPSPKLPRGTPEAQGISSAAILDFINAAEGKIDALHSFMLVRHGRVVAEGWWAPYAADEPHMMFSLSKSFTSTAVGLAIADGKLSVDDPVLKFFPEDAPAEPGKNLQAMRVRDLLTMSTGHHEEDIKGFPFSSQENLVKKFLALPVAHKPGTLFVYNTPASYMLSAIVQKVTGQTVLDYLRPRLFAPLGIADPTWETSAQGISLGGFGLSIRTEAIAKFGQLYLQKGEWHGQQLVPAEWIAEATARQMSNGSDPAGNWDQGYGYQFWRCPQGFYRGDGAFGQFCIVMPQYDAVIAITSGTKDMASVMNLIWERIVPALQDAALPEDAVAHEKLAAKLASLVLPTPSGAADSAVAKTVAGRRYVFPGNPQAIESISLDVANAGGDVSFTAKIAGVEQHIIAGRGAWRKGALAAGPDAGPIAASGAWTADDTYTLRLCRYRTPFVITYQLRFAGEQLFVDSEQNVGNGDLKRAQIIGKSE